MDHNLANDNWTRAGYDIGYAIALAITGFFTFTRGIKKVREMKSGVKDTEKNYAIRLMLVQIFLSTGFLCASFSFWFGSSGIFGSIFGNGYYCNLTLSIFTLHSVIEDSDDYEKVLTQRTLTHWIIPAITFSTLVIFELSLK